MTVFFCALLAAVCWQSAARYVAIPTVHVSQVLPAAFWGRGNIHKELALAAVQSRPARVRTQPRDVYAYSVVPGGVRDTGGLRLAASRDAVVRQHYRHFDFEHAHWLRAAEAREVYLSYRIRNTVFWTRRKVRLHIGELLLTDGKITARARCGNQISDTAKPEVSEEEPDEDVLDRPVAELENGPSFPVRASLAALELPSGEPTAPQLFAGNFSFPYVPSGISLPSTCTSDQEVKKGRCRQKRKPPTVAEPSALLLLGSGLILVLWRYRRASAPHP